MEVTTTQPKRKNKKYADGLWKNFLVDKLGGIKHPVLVNGVEIDNLQQDHDVYVYIDIVQPGRHIYSVRYHDQFHLHSTMIRERDEDIKPFNKLQHKYKV